MVLPALDFFIVQNGGNRPCCCFKCLGIIRDHSDWNPYLDVKRLKLRIIDADVMSGTKSKCIALVVQQVYRQIHVFFYVDGISYKGPVKSTPLEEKGRLSRTLNDGSGGAAGGR